MRERGCCHSIRDVRGGRGEGVLCNDSSHGLASDDRANSAIVFKIENMRKSAVKEARIVKRKSHLQFHFIYWFRYKYNNKEAPEAKRKQTIIQACKHNTCITEKNLGYQCFLGMYCNQTEYCNLYIKIELKQYE